MNATIAGKAPAHLWIVGVLSLVWNLFGACDYTLSEMRNPWYMSQFPPELITVLNGFPAWAIAAWAIGVWASLAGAVLLLLRSRHAALAFVISFLGAVVSFVYQARLELPASVDTTASRIMPIVVIVLIVAQWWYARVQAKARVLS